MVARQDPLLETSTARAIFAPEQFLPGYILLYPVPQVGDLHLLDEEQRAKFLGLVSGIGEVLARECNALRINYLMLGNLDPYLHAHIIPRYSWEPDEYRKGPASLYPDEVRANLPDAFSAKQLADLHDRIRSSVRHL